MVFDNLGCVSKCVELAVVKAKGNSNWEDRAVKIPCVAGKALLR